MWIRLTPYCDALWFHIRQVSFWPYTSEHFLAAPEPFNVEHPDLAACFPCDRGFKFELLFEDPGVATMVANLSSLSVKIDKKTSVCALQLGLETEFRVRTNWVPYWVADDVVTAALSR